MSFLVFKNVIVIKKIIYSQQFLDMSHGVKYKYILFFIFSSLSIIAIRHCQSGVVEGKHYIEDGALVRLHLHRLYVDCRVCAVVVKVIWMNLIYLCLQLL